MENFSNKVRRRKLYLPRNDNVSPVCNSWNYATSYALHTLGMRGTIESRSILSWNSQLIQVLFNRFFSWLPLFFKKNCVVHANQKALRVIYRRWTFNLLTRSTAPMNWKGLSCRTDIISVSLNLQRPGICWCSSDFQNCHDSHTSVCWGNLTSLTFRLKQHWHLTKWQRRQFTLQFHFQFTLTCDVVKYWNVWHIQSREVFWILVLHLPPS